MAKATNLTFQFKSGNQFSGKQGRFEIEGLTASSEIEFDEITFYIEDEKYEGGISSFTSNSLSAEELFSDVVNAYLRDDVTDFEFNDDWNIFDSIKNSSKYQGQILISFPQDDFGIIDYECMLKTDEFGFYSHDDLFLMLDDNNGIVTDTELFFTQALDDEIEDIQNGKKKALYTGEEFDAYVAEYFGESKRTNTMKLNLFENKENGSWENYGDVNFLDGGQLAVLKDISVLFEAAIHYDVLGGIGSVAVVRRAPGAGQVPVSEGAHEQEFTFAPFYQGLVCFAHIRERIGAFSLGLLQKLECGVAGGGHVVQIFEASFEFLRIFKYQGLVQSLPIGIEVAVAGLSGETGQVGLSESVGEGADRVGPGCAYVVEVGSTDGHFKLGSRLPGVLTGTFEIKII